MNNVALVGRTGADVKVHTFNDGTQQGEFSLATTETFKVDGEKKEHTEWHRIVVRGKGVAAIERYVGKGSLVEVTGRLRTRKFTDRNGVERTIVFILGQVGFISLKEPGAGEAPAESSEPVALPAVDDEIPF